MKMQPSSKQGSSRKSPVVAPKTARKGAAGAGGRPGNSTRLEVIPKALPAPAATSARATPRVRFGYFQPQAREVFVVGSFNNWDTRATPMQRDGLGDWSVELELPPGQYHYRLWVDGEWRDDPSAQQTAMNPFGGFDAVVVV